MALFSAGLQEILAQYAACRDPEQRQQLESRLIHLQNDYGSLEIAVNEWLFIPVCFIMCFSLYHNRVYNVGPNSSVFCSTDHIKYCIEKPR
jgi:hypothetical protein